ncbi:MAG: Gfo/Idh/MocA family oxidoreductase, partial [Bacteroidota bacterium]
RAAWNLWESEVLGEPLHFDIKYYHGDYLAQSYREKRRTRLTPAPDGGAMADLGSHALSLAVSFFGPDLHVLQATQAGGFADVPEGSDLYSSLSLLAPKSGAVGQVSASRISAGTGDLISIEAFGTKGAIRFNTHRPDEFEYYSTEADTWTRKMVGSRYAPVTSFPSGHVPPGWLRAMVHAHYMFLTGDQRGSFTPDLAHGLAVQRLVRETAEHLHTFRQIRQKLQSEG